jgi:ribosomal protein L24E
LEAEEGNKMAVAKCAFCGVEQEDFKGSYYVKNDGSVLYFSSGKCMKNHLKLKRDKRKVRWAEAFHIVRKKRMDKLKEASEKVNEKKVQDFEGMKKRAVEKAEKIIEEKIAKKN